MKAKVRKIVAGCAVIAATVVVDNRLSNNVPILSDVAILSAFIDDAHARLGRPVSPISVAGVARRTVRRGIRRSTIYVATLPKGCTTVVIDGTNLHQCGTTYYQPYKNQYEVVYVD